MPPSVVGILTISQLDTAIQKDNRLLSRINTTLKTLSINKENPIIKERIKSLVKIKLTVQNKLKLELKQKLKLQRQTIKIPPTKIKVKVPPIIKIPADVSKTKLVKALIKIKRKQGIDVVVGMGKKQKIIAKNLPPFKALKFGRDFVDKNIAASFRLRKSGKKTKKKDIKPFNIGNKFRPSKRNVLFLVEKRKFRLDSPSFTIVPFLFKILLQT